MKYRSLFVGVFAAHLTAACETTPEPQIEIQTITVEVPVAVDCVPAGLPPRPVYQVTREALLLAPDAAARLALAVVGLLERDARLAETEPVLEACRPGAPK
jgi:hypothetical protein